MPALLTAIDSALHIHLIIGSNPLAGARCAKSIEVGAKPILITPEESSNLHYGLINKIETGEVEWIKREFRDEDLTSLGREEVDRVIDAVFVTGGRKYGQSELIRINQQFEIVASRNVVTDHPFHHQVHTFQLCVAVSESLSMSPMHLIFVALLSSLLILMDLCK